MAEEEAAVLDALFELLVVVALVDVGIAVGLCLRENVLLDFIEESLDVRSDAFQRTGLLL